MTAPVFSWLKDRSAGILLHPTSLPGTQGIGVMGIETFRWIDFLKESGVRYWQILPTGHTGFGDSPYQCFSAFAGNPYWIDLDELILHRLLTHDECQYLSELPQDRVHFDALYQIKWPLLRLAFKRFQDSGKRALGERIDFAAFCKNESEWLEPYAAYMAFKDKHGGSPWYEWESRYQTFSKARKTPLFKQLSSQMEAWSFFQYIFWHQWERIKTAANQVGIEIIGDLPIFVSKDSADVWAFPELFQIDKSGALKVVAGVPPDYFSEDGQLWGNPLYNWDHLKQSGYSWWIKRLAQGQKLYDVVRLDHFRGFANYWEIPAESPTAKTGRWVDGPGLDFFIKVKAALPELNIIAEDLGELDEKVFELLRQTGLPGMSVLHFAFDAHPDNIYLPCNVNPNNIMYPGTHDNDTTVGWYRSQNAQTQDQVRRYLRVSGEDIAWDLIRLAFGSVSKLCVFTAQDLLSLGTTARMNLPGTAQGNWAWRMTSIQYEKIRVHTTYLKELGTLYNRLPKAKTEA
jgi:4-alpha-glucanotransferase